MAGGFGSSSMMMPQSQIKAAAPEDPKKPKIPTAAQQSQASVGGWGQQFLSTRPEAPKPQQVTPQQVNAANINPQGFSQFEQALNVASGNVQTAGQMDPKIAQFLQAAQQSGQYSPQAIAQMQQAAMGQGPSAAQAQLQSGVDQSVQAQMAAAASRGFSPAAMRGAQMQSAQMQQSAVNQAAQLRAQEQQAAQQAFLQAALQQEQMQRQAAMQAAGLTLDQSVQGQQLKQAAINAQLQGAGQFAGLAQQSATAQAQLAQQAALANQDAFLKAGMFNQTMPLEAFQAQQQANLGFAGLGGDLLKAQMGSLTGVDLAAAQRAFEANQNRQNRNFQILGGLIGAGGAVGAAAASDRKMKKEIKVNKETQAFLNALTDNEYKYKDPTKVGTAPGTQYGPMAQDLAKTKMGKTAVIEGPDGLMIDSSRGFLLALSGLANINQRLSKLENS